MTDRSIKIIADSSSDILSLENIRFSSVPLKIMTEQSEYTDNENLNVEEMVAQLQNYKGKSSTSCPNSAEWLEAFEDSKEVICLAITATLSGSYNAAMAAKQEYEEMHPDRKVFALNSLTTGPELSLIADKAKALIEAGRSFEEIVDGINNYSSNTGLIFMLESMKNLANNGRVSHIVAKMAGLLGIRVVGKASNKGDLEPLNKCRGEEKALSTIFEHMQDNGYKGGKVKISHCLNENAAKKLQLKISDKFPSAVIEIYPCRGLCSFYAEKGGLLVGFEKF